MKEEQLVYLSPLYLVGMWLLITYLLSLFGWKKFIPYFQTSDTAYGTKIHLVSAKIGRVNYNNCLKIEMNEHGFYIRPIFLFRLFHPTLFIPWKEISSVSKRSLIFSSHYRLSIGNPEIGTITLPKKTFEKLRPYIELQQSNRSR